MNEKKDNAKGYVYILTNPSFREDWVKIGKSSRPVDVRSKELDNTAVPLPFEIYATLATAKYDKVEKLIHKTIDRLSDLRIRQNREFFNVQPSVALDILKDIAQTLEDAELVVANEDGCEDKEVDEDGNVVKKGKKSKPSFRFSMIGLKTGDKIKFDPTGIEVVVSDDKKIDYKDRLWSLSAFTAEFLPENMKNTSNAYQGPKYFSFNGKTLDEIRKDKGV